MAGNERTAASRVHAELARRIEDGTLTARTLLSESELAKQLKISRTPVREALLMLEGGGLVRHYPGRGYQVAEITPRDIDEIFELRLQLELLALRKAYPVLEPEQLEEQLAALRGLGPDATADDYYCSDRGLHSMIIQSCGNVRLQNFLHKLNSQIERIRYISARAPDRLKASREEHIALLEALLEKNLPLAELRLKQHIENVRRSTKRVCCAQQMRDPCGWGESECNITK